MPKRVAESLRLVVALGLLLLVFSVMADHFFTSRTFSSVANQIPSLLVVAVGMTYVIVLGGIDLSVGSLLALCGGVMGVATAGLHLPLPLAVLMCLAVGAGVGAVNGMVMVRWRLPAFIVTLGMLEIARGGAYLVTHSQTQYIGASIESISEVAVLGLSLPFFLALALVFAAQWTLDRTVFGRYVVATGTNEEAVRLSGVDTSKIRVAVYTLCGFLAGLGAIIHTARLGAADPNAGGGLELQAIAAVVVGGTSLMGGRGSVVGTLFGVLIIAVLDTGLAQVGAQEPAKRVITGLVIVGAVILDNYRHGRRHG
ncbi:MAG: ABC transporter permease [Deltaproteobacteria bacterium]|nr:ABC transporter permease [Deltaproteobacteria bacterium]